MLGSAGSQGVSEVRGMTGELLVFLSCTALQRLNTSYHHTADKQTGPLARRLQSFGKLEGLVVGPWGEGSKDLHSLLFSITILL